MSDPPPLALSVRQPWAWAILHGGKVIENRSLGSIKAGGMDCRRIAIHAASDLKEDEYRWGHWRLAKHGVTCPRSEDLPRRAIIGAVTVTDIITESESEWFGGQAGLVLADPATCDPVPAPGALGYFEWRAGGSLAPVKPWMLAYDRPSGDSLTGELFPDLPPSFAQDPNRPGRTRK